MRKAFRNIAILAFAFAILGCESTAQQTKPFLHPLFTDNMVLQRDVRFPIWGWTEPGKKITVQLLGKTATATADAQGRWQVTLGPFPAGGPYTVTISGPQLVTLQNVLIGDVWLCSGQSNMEMGIGVIDNAAKEIADANYPQIRLFTVEKAIATEPQSLVKGQWQACSSRTVSNGGWGGFSAVGYFFGRELHEDLKVPIGLIHSSWGGTPAEAWTSAEPLSKMADFQPYIDDFRRTVDEAKKGAFDLEKAVNEWWQTNDPGSAAKPAWSDSTAEISSWKTMKLPTNWEEAGLPSFDGIVWFSRTFTLPENWAGKDLMLHLGPIDDADTTWVNGVKVGGLNVWDAQRDYRVPASILKPGLNTIRVRIMDTGGPGGIYGKPDQLKLELATGNSDAIRLDGEWKYQETASSGKLKPFPQIVSQNPNLVTVLYNGMIAPLVPFSLKGAIWYQGEANAGRGFQYRTLLPTMITDWRTRFGSDFPFYIVQLANFMEERPSPTESQWAELREAQLLTSQNLAHTGLAVTIDIGDAKDIHPKNKQEVGHRLALAARALTYGEKIEYSGPGFRKMNIDGNKVHLTFDHVAGGLVAKGGNKLRGFAIAGEDKKFVWADAVIEGDTVVVWSSQISNPTAVRYDWADNPNGNLYNKANLPASPFRTDSGGK